MLQFWNERMTEISDASDLRSQLLLPLARIKRIMKSDKEVKMVSGDASVLVAKAIEIFVMELTFRSWLNTQKDYRGTLHGYDIAQAIRYEELLSLLLSDVVHVSGCKEETNCSKETELPLAYQLHMQNMNPQDEANNPKETELQLTRSMHLQNMNLAYMGYPEFRGPFAASMSSVPSNYRSGAEDEANNPKETELQLARSMHLQNMNPGYMGYPEFCGPFPTSMSSVPSKYRSGAEGYMGYPEFRGPFGTSMSSVPSNYHSGPETFHTRETEFFEPLTSSMSSTLSNYRLGSEAFHTRKPEQLVALPPSISSLPSTNCPGSEAFVMRNQDISEFASSMPSAPSKYLPGSEIDNGDYKLLEVFTVPSFLCLRSMFQK